MELVSPRNPPLLTKRNVRAKQAPHNVKELRIRRRAFIRKEEISSLISLEKSLGHQVLCPFFSQKRGG